MTTRVFGAVIAVAFAANLSAAQTSASQDDCQPTALAISQTTIQKNRLAIESGDSIRKKALADLLARASTLLNTKIDTIGDKTLTPPSGNKQDYMSLGPYWWPNPETPDGLPWIRKDGMANPLAYAEDTDKQRLNKMINSVEMLSLAYAYTGELRFAQKAAEILHVWFVDPQTRINPHLKYAQSIPGITDGRSYGIIDARPFMNVVDALALIECSAAFSAKQRVAMSNWFTQFLDWLLNSDLGIEERQAKNNHGTHYDAIAVAIALYLRDTQTATRLLQASATRITEQIDDSGAQPHELSRTRPFHYSLFNLEAYFRLAEMASTLDIDLWNYPSSEDARLRTALDYLIARQSVNDWQGKQESALNISRLDSYARRAKQAYADGQYNRLIDISEEPERALNCSLLFIADTDNVLQASINVRQAATYRRCSY